MSAESKETWAAGDPYERYVGRWSHAVARRFVAWLDLPPRRRWLDVACGTGALSAGILAAADPEAVLGIDLSEGFLEFARAQLPDPRVRFEAGDAQALPIDDDDVHAAVSGLALNFVPDQPRAIAEMARVVRAGGTVALYVWDYAGAMQLMRHFWGAAAALDPAAAKLDEGRRFPVCRPEPLAALLRAAGLEAVAICPIDVATEFADFDDYWSPFLGGQGPAPGYCMSLSEERRAELRERLRSTLPAAADGRIALIARAWAVRGTVPRTTGREGAP